VDNRLDLTDQFVFRGETGTVFVMDVNSSAAGPDAPQGFHPDARYEFKIHTDGAPFEQLTYRVTFGVPDQAGEQAVALHLLTGPDARDDDAAGQLLAEGRTHTPVLGPGGLRLWAGRAADPFYVDLTQVFAISAAVKNGAKVDLSGWRPEAAKSSLPAPPSTRSWWRLPTRIRTWAPTGPLMAMPWRSTCCPTCSHRTGTKADFGFVEQNGRWLADNAPGAMFCLVMNAAQPTGLTPGQFADTRSGQFPYVVAKPATAQ
jgi:hypothetical protein